MADEFFKLPDEAKKRYEQAEIFRQRFTPFGVEHAKDNIAPDLKEFYKQGELLTTLISHRIFGPQSLLNSKNQLMDCTTLWSQ